MSQWKTKHFVNTVSVVDDMYDRLETYIHQEFNKHNYNEEVAMSVEDKSALKIQETSLM